MKILITGGNGFVGRNLANKLDGIDVLSVTRSDFDLCDTHQVNEYFSDKYFDVVIHTAIKGGSRLKVDGNDVIYTNIVMYHNLMCNKLHFGKLINIGSGAEMNKSNEPYGLSKRIIMDSVMKTDNFYNLRVYGLFGPDELDTRFIKANIIRYVNKETMIVDKNKYMSFFYIDDFVNVIKYYITEKSPQKCFDCRYQDDVTLVDIAKMINNLSDYNMDIIVNGVDDSYVGKYTNIGINYVGLENGIKEMYNLLNI